jgi:hypothetical protein
MGQITEVEIINKKTGENKLLFEDLVVIAILWTNLVLGSF